MRILHTSDWHLGKKLDNFSRIEEQKQVLAEICKIADQEKVDVVIIAGDLFDTYNPGTEAEELFYKTLKKLAKNGSRPVIAIAGNHDSPDRIEVPDPLAKECGIILAGFPNTKIPAFKLDTGIEIINTEPGFLELKLAHLAYSLRLLYTPYANEFRLKTFLDITDTEEELRQILAKHWQKAASKYCDTGGVNILMAHLFMMQKNAPQPEEPDDEKPILYLGGAQPVFTTNIPAQIQYTALGHLHKKQIVSEKNMAVYSGTPLSYSMSEAEQDKYVIITEIKPGTPAKLKPIKLQNGRKLIRKTFTEVDLACIWLQENQNTIVELTMKTDMFMAAEDIKKIHKVHDYVKIIPEVKNRHVHDYKTTNIDLTKSMEELFSDYFKHEKNGLAPNKDILNIFKEIYAQEER